MFHVKHFHPYITQDVNKALNFASKWICISKCDIDAIHHPRKSLLFDYSQAWIKKQEGLFDVSIGAYDGAEVCELVGTYILNLLFKKYNKSHFGIYCAHGLTILKNIVDRNQKSLTQYLTRVP